MTGDLHEKVEGSLVHGEERVQAVTLKKSKETQHSLLIVIEYWPNKELVQSQGGILSCTGGLLKKCTANAGEEGY